LLFQRRAFIKALKKARAQKRFLSKRFLAFFMFRVYNPTRRRAFPKEIFVRAFLLTLKHSTELLKTERERKEVRSRRRRRRRRREAK